MLPSRPADEHQRLIHRGRLLAREADTLQDVFGLEMLRTGDNQTLHLVLRDTSADNSPAPTQSPSPAAPIHAPTQPMPTRDQSPAPGLPPAHTHQHHRAHNLRSGTPGWPTQMPGYAAPPGYAVPPGYAAPPGMAQVIQQHQQNQQQHHQTMVQWMNQLQRESNYRIQILAQQRRERAAMGFPDAQDNNAQGNAADHAGGRNSPATVPTVQTTTRELVSPNGQHFRVTVNETFAGPHSNHFQAVSGPTSNPAGRGPLSASDVQNIIRGADATQATQTMTDAMHRSASGASLASMASLANINGPIQPIQPGVTTPLHPSISRHASRTATPDPSVRSIGHGPGFMPTTFTQSQSQAHSQPSQGQPEVYILSSPSGPRGLLINGPSEMYTTPAFRLPYLPVRVTPPALQPWPAQVQIHQPQPQHQHQHQHQHHPQPQQNPIQRPLQAHGQIQQARGHRAAVRLQPGLPPGFRQMPAHPNNPGAGALMAAAWPHIWLIVRLVVFVWWFTSNDPSWSRWLTMVAIAIGVFVLNTGLLNGMANQAWEPFRQHLEGLIPLADPNRRPDPTPAPAPGPLRDGDGVAAVPATTPHAADPSPAQAAARLVANHRHANTNWLMDQVRRVERAGLLFLASIAPGVAERHIANLEAQERAERERREAEEAAAAAAAATAAAEATASQNGLQEAGTGQENEQDRGRIPEVRNRFPEEQPLVQI